jgi:hypothetical protein
MNRRRRVKTDSSRRISAGDDTKKRKNRPADLIAEAECGREEITGRTACFRRYLFSKKRHVHKKETIQITDELTKERAAPEQDNYVKPGLPGGQATRTRWLF